MREDINTFGQAIPVNLGEAVQIMQEPASILSWSCLNTSLWTCNLWCSPRQRWFTKAPLFWHNTEHSWNGSTFTNPLHTAYPTWNQRSCLAAHGYISSRCIFCWWWLKCLQQESTIIVIGAESNKQTKTSQDRACKYAAAVLCCRIPQISTSRETVEWRLLSARKEIQDIEESRIEKTS